MTLSQDGSRSPRWNRSTVTSFVLVGLGTADGWSPPDAAVLFVGVSLAVAAMAVGVLDWPLKPTADDVEREAILDHVEEVPVEWLASCQELCVFE